MKAFGRKAPGWIQSAARSRLVRTSSLALLAVFAAGLLVWFATPWSTEAARYTWREWQAPQIALLLNQHDAALAMEIGNRYYGTIFAGNAKPLHDPALAKRAFGQAVGIEPGILWGHYSLARIAFTEGDFKSALEKINAELEANPENLRALYVRGLIYGYRNLPGDLYLAELDFSRFTEWAPSEWAGYNDLAWILAKEGKFAEMERAMLRALERVQGEQGHAWLWNALGIARLNLGDKAGAAKAFEQALAYAEQLTLADWRRSYSGNNPEGDRAGLDAFLAGIRENLVKARG